MHTHIIQQAMASQMAQYAPMQRDGVMMVPFPVPMGNGLCAPPAPPPVSYQVPAGWKLVPLEEPDEPEPKPKPHTANKIFVGGLNRETTAEALRDHFQQFGEIADSVVVSQPGTKKSRCFGFVEFADGIPEGLFDLEHIVEQRRCRVKRYSTDSAPYSEAAPC
jgi:hypothetical protein